MAEPAPALNSHPMKPRPRNYRPGSPWYGSIKFGALVHIYREKVFNYYNDPKNTNSPLWRELVGQKNISIRDTYQEPEFVIGPKQHLYSRLSQEEQRKDTTISLRYLLLNFPFVRIFGEAGQGKTSLCQYLCATLNNPVETKINLELGRRIVLPVYLSDLFKAKGEEPKFRDIEDFFTRAASSIARKHGIRYIPPAFLDWALRRGVADLVIDEMDLFENRGGDTIGLQLLLQGYVEQNYGLKNNLGYQSSIILLGRPRNDVQSWGIFLACNFVVRYDERSIRHFAINHLKDNQIEEFIQTTRKHGWDKNEQLISLVCRPINLIYCLIYFRMENRVPGSKVEMLRKLLPFMLNKERNEYLELLEPKDKSTPSLPTVDALYTALARVAYQHYCRGRTIDRQRIEDALPQALVSESANDTSDGQIEITSDFLLDRADMLYLRFLKAPEEYRFTHDYLGEFLAAEYIYSRHRRLPLAQVLPRAIQRNNYAVAIDYFDLLVDDLGSEDLLPQLEGLLAEVGQIEIPLEFLLALFVESENFSPAKHGKKIAQLAPALFLLACGHLSIATLSGTVATRFIKTYLRGGEEADARGYDELCLVLQRLRSGSLPNSATTSGLETVLKPMVAPSYGALPLFNSYLLHFHIFDSDGDTNQLRQDLQPFTGYQQAYPTDIKARALNLDTLLLWEAKGLVEGVYPDGAPDALADFPELVGVHQAYMLCLPSPLCLDIPGRRIIEQLSEMLQSRDFGKKFNPNRVANALSERLLELRYKPERTRRLLEYLQILSGREFGAITQAQQQLRANALCCVYLNWLSDLSANIANSAEISRQSMPQAIAYQLAQLQRIFNQYNLLDTNGATARFEEAAPLLSPGEPSAKRAAWLQLNATILKHTKYSSS